MPSVSAIILTKDSQRTIEACLKALKPAVDSIIAVDTGSVDDTVQIAKTNGAYVYGFEWCDDFSAARNFGDSLATSDWVIHVDSDEILRPEDTDKIRKACAQYKKTINPVVIGIQQINVMADTVQSELVIRMYKRNFFAWRGIIHEQLFSRRGEIPHLIQPDVGVIHDGYNLNAINVQEKTLTRNINLLKKAIGQEPNNAVYRYFLGRDYASISEYEVAILHLRVAIDLAEQQNMFNLLEDAQKLLKQCLDVDRATAQQ